MELIFVAAIAIVLFVLPIVIIVALVAFLIRQNRVPRGIHSMRSFFVDKQQCSHHHIFPGVDIYTTFGDELMLSLVEFEPHAVVEEHSHPHEQMGLMLEGEAEFIVGGQSRLVRAGEMWRIPGGVKHKVIAGDRPVRALDVFHPIRDDYR